MKEKIPSQTHDKSLFYKYVSAEVAKIVLVNKTLRWSSPLLFDDRYDVTRELAAGLEPSEMQECIINRIIDLVQSAEELPSGLYPNLRFILETLRKSGRDDLKEKVINTLHDSKSGLIRESQGLSELKIMWDAMLPMFRILCLSARNNIVKMWERYADEYRGVVLEFACLKELDPPWLIAKPVLYENRPSLLDKADWGGS